MKIIRSSQFSWRRPASSLLSMMMMLVLSACHAQSPDSAGEDKADAKIPLGTPLSLTLQGFNYTDKYIDRFQVDGLGGGNIFVSTETNGGGKSACCVSYVLGASARKVKIRWQTDACRFNERISRGQKYSNIHSFFKEVEVQVDRDIPEHPRYFEVHFYPDGHVEAAMTEQASRPRLILSKSREDNTPYPRCPDGKKPEQ
jgi:hypothetical protein